MNHIIESAKQIEKTHKGLGLLTMLNQLCIDSHSSVFNIGFSGNGKGAIIGALKDDKFDISQDLDTLTLTNIVNMWFQHGEVLQDISMLWKIEEFNTLQEYHRQLFLTIGSKLISNKFFTHDMGSPKNPIRIDFRNVNLSVVIGLQPIVYSKLVNNVMWEGLSRDRFIKVVCINPLRKQTLDFIPKFNMNSYLPKSIGIPDNPKFVTRLLINQISEARSELYAKRLLSQYMKYEHYLTYKPKYELEFVKLFGFYIKLISELTYIEELGEGDKISASSWKLLDYVLKHCYVDNKEISQNDLFDNLRLQVTSIDDQSDDYNEESKKRVIRRYTSLLVKRKLLQKTKNSPVKYSIGKSLEDFFMWYNKVLN